jgi:Flp pilus assembly protein TadD
MRVDDHCEFGVKAFRDGDIDTAVYELERATMEDRESFRAFTYLGAAYVEQGRYNSAIGAFKRATELKPDVAKVHYNLGQAYEAAGVPREAWFEYKNALEIEPYYQPAKAALSLLGARMITARQQRLAMAS